MKRCNGEIVLDIFLHCWEPADRSALPLTVWCLDWFVSREKQRGFALQLAVLIFIWRITLTILILSLALPSNEHLSKKLHLGGELMVGGGCNCLVVGMLRTAALGAALRWACPGQQLPGIWGFDLAVRRSCKDSTVGV